MSASCNVRPRIQQHTGADATALDFGINGKALEHEQRDGVTWHAFNDPLRGVRVTDLADDDGVDADDLAVAHGNVSLGGIRLLSLQRAPEQKAITSASSPP